MVGVCDYGFVLMLVVSAVHADMNVNMILVSWISDPTAMEFNEYSDGNVTMMSNLFSV